MAAPSVRSFASRYGGIAHYFPGHMAKAARELGGLLSRADVVIEVRDARVPFSSANPGLDSLVRGSSVPRVVVFNKADLASEALQGRVAATVHARCDGAPCVFTSADRGAGVARILSLVDSFETRSSRFRAAGAVMAVVGVPNVGKSTLINALRDVTRCRSGRGAGVAPLPGFTRAVTPLRVRRDPALWLFDSPGIMLPRVPDVETGLKLAVTTALRAAAVPPSVQAEYLLYAFATTRATAWSGALGLSRAYEEDDVETCLAEIAERLRAVRGGSSRGGAGAAGGLGSGSAGGALDTDAAAWHLVRAFQAGKLGRHTLDWVPEVDAVEVERVLSDVRERAEAGRVRGGWGDGALKLTPLGSGASPRVDAVPLPGSPIARGLLAART